MVYSIIKKSQLEGALRLDAEYYQPEYLNLISKIKSQKSKVSFGDLLEKITHPKEIKREYNESGYIFLLAQNVRPGFLDFSEKRYFSKEVAKTMPQNLLKKGDILFVRTGAVGDVGVYLGKPENVLASAHVLIARSNFKVSPYYLMIYFNTQSGKNLIIRGTYGALQPEIAPDYLKTIPVPVFDKSFENEIEQIVFESNELLKKSEYIYSQAENLLLEELGLKDFESEDELFSIVNLSDVKSVHRADAEYFQPIYQNLESRIRKYEAKILSDLVSMKKGVEPGSEEYQEEGKLFIRVSSMSRQGIIDKDQKYVSEKLYAELRKDFEPKVGEILLTKDATPGIAYVIKEPIEGIISSGILRLKIKNEIDAEYLALCINSIVGQSQAERDSGGSIIAHWKPEQIKNVLIPILPKPAQQKIADLVQKSHEARIKAKQLLGQAKQKVEELIEK